MSRSNFSQKKKKIGACSTLFIYISLPCLARHHNVELPELPSYTTGGKDAVRVNILIFTWQNGMSPSTFGEGGGGLIIGCMLCLQIEGPIVGAGGGGGSGGSRSSDKRRGRSSSP